MNESQNWNFMARKAIAPTLENFIDNIAIFRNNININDNTIKSELNSSGTLSSLLNENMKKKSRKSSNNYWFANKTTSSKRVVKSKDNGVLHKLINVEKDNNDFNYLIHRRNNIKQKLKSIIQLKQTSRFSLEEIVNQVKFDFDENAYAAKKPKKNNGFNKTVIIKENMKGHLWKKPKQIKSSSNVWDKSCEKNKGVNNKKRSRIKFCWDSNGTPKGNKVNNMSLFKSKNESKNNIINVPVGKEVNKAETSSENSEKQTKKDCNYKDIEDNKSSTNTLQSVNSANTLTSNAGPDVNLLSTAGNNFISKIPLRKISKNKQTQSLKNMQWVSIQSQTLNNTKNKPKAKFESFIANAKGKGKLMNNWSKMTLEEKQNVIQNELTWFIENEYRKLNQLLNRKVYDSLSDTEDETIITDYLIPVKSAFNTIWKIIILIVVMYNIIIIPVYITFLSQTDKVVFLYFNIITNLIYIADIVITFFQPFLKQNITNDDENTWYETAHAKISLNYFWGWFYIDFISAIPYYLMINIKENFNEHLYTSKILYNLIVLIPNIKLLKMAFKRQSSTNDHMTTSLRLILFFVIFWLFNHFISCLYCFISLSSFHNWVSTSGLNYHHEGVKNYFSSMYFHLSTIYTIGYGDVVPISFIEKIYNIFLQSVGIFLYSFVVCSVSTLLKKTHREEALTEKMVLLDTLKLQYGWSEGLYWKIRKFIMYDFENSNDNQKHLLENFPNSMKNLVISSMYKNDILLFKIFKNTNMEFKSKVIMNLRPILTEKGEFVIKKGEIYDNVIFNKKGILDIEWIYQGYIVKISQIRIGENYGEINMWLNKSSEYDIVVKSKVCECMLLSKQILIEICYEFSEFTKKIHSKAWCNYNWFKWKAKRKIKEIELKILEKNEDKDNENVNSLDDESEMKMNNYMNKYFPPREDNIDIIHEERNEEENEEDVIDISKKWGHLNSITHRSSSKRANNSKTSITNSQKASSNITNHNHLPINNLTQLTYPENNSNSKISKTASLSVPKSNKIYNKSSSINQAVKKPKSTTTLNKVWCNEDKSWILSNGNNCSSMKNIYRSPNKIKQNKMFVRMLSTKGSQIQTCANRRHSSWSPSKNMNSLTTKLRRHTKLMNKNIYEGCWSIKSPTMFYESVFTKWKVIEQIRKIDLIYQKIQGKTDV